MEDFSIIGILAGSLTTIAFVPQVIKVMKTKLTRDISFAWVLIVWVGIVLWLTYGLLIRDVALIAANSFSLPLVTIIVVYKLKFK